MKTLWILIRSASLFLHENICCGYSLEVPQWGTSNEYPQHMFSWKNKKNVSTFRLEKGACLELCPYLGLSLSVLCFMENRHTFRGDNSVKIVFFPSERGLLKYKRICSLLLYQRICILIQKNLLSSLIQKKNASHRNKFISFIVDPFSEGGLLCRKANQKVTEVVSLV